MLCYGKKALDSVQVLNLGFQVCFGGNTTLSLMYRGCVLRVGVWFVLFLSIVVKSALWSEGNVQSSFKIN